LPGWISRGCCIKPTGHGNIQTDHCLYPGDATINLKQLFQDYVLDPLRKPEPRDTQFHAGDVLFCFRFLKPLWKIGVLGLGLTVLTSIMGSITPLSSKVLIDFVIMKDPTGSLGPLLQSLHLSFLAEPARHLLGSLNLLVLAGIIFGVVSGGLRLLQGILNFRFTNELSFNVQTELFDRVLRYPLSIHKKKQVGYLMSRITGDVHAVPSFFSQFSGQLLNSFFQPFISFFILFQMNRQLTLILLAIIPLNVLVNYWIMVRSRALSQRQMEGSANISGHMMEALSGVEVVKSFGAESRESRKVAGWMRRLLDLQLKGFMLSNLAGNITGILNLGVRLFVMWFSAREVMKGAMTVGDLTSFSWYAMTLYNSLNGLLNQLLSLQYLLVSLGRLHEMFSIAPETRERHERQDLIVPPKLSGAIQYREVQFGYEPSMTVLKGLSLEVAAGETIAITGPSGAGKTTLMSLLLKFFTPRAGTIYLDGMDLQKIDTRWFRSQVGIVSQETFLFNDTIEHNIRYGKPSATMEEVVEAARKAHIHEDIEGFENGYGTVVGERGTALSVGQKQRISLARTFLKDPPILILDEPTSALDRDTELALSETLREVAKNRTTLIITHRMPIVSTAHRMFVLKDGRLEEQTDSAFEQTK
jgi:ABC-type multidrug transport system fused ATPase/permease subunit